MNPYSAFVKPFSFSPIKSKKAYSSYSKGCQRIWIHYDQHHILAPQIGKLCETLNLYRVPT